MKARGGSAREAGGRTGPGGGNGETDGRGERSRARRWEGVGFLRGGTSPNPDLLPAKVESVFWGRTGGMARILLTLPRHPPRNPEILPRDGVGEADGKAGQVFEKLKA